MRKSITNPLGVAIAHDAPEIKVVLSRAEIDALKAAMSICERAHKMLEEHYGTDYDDMARYTPYHDAAIWLGEVLED